MRLLTFLKTLGGILEDLSDDEYNDGDNIEETFDDESSVNGNDQSEHTDDKDSVNNEEILLEVRHCVSCPLHGLYFKRIVDMEDPKKQIHHANGQKI